MSERVLNILKSFDPTNESHVAWLKDMTCTEPEQYLRVLRASPIKHDLGPSDIMDWAQLHMCLCAKYVKYLFKK